MDLREIVQKISRLHLLHRLYIQKTALQNHLYFGQPPLLEYVMDHDGCTQSDVAEFLHVSPPSVATSIKRMEKMGLIARTPDPRDARCNRLHITDEGRQLTTAFRAQFDSVDQQMFAGLSPQEIEQLIATVEHMIANLAVGPYAGLDNITLRQQAKQLKEAEHRAAHSGHPHPPRPERGGDRR